MTITEFEYRKPNVFRNFLDLIGYDYDRIIFKMGRDRYVITSWGNVFINGYHECNNVYDLPKETVDEIYDELKKMY